MVADFCNNLSFVNPTIIAMVKTAAVLSCLVASASAFAPSSSTSQQVAARPANSVVVQATAELEGMLGVGPETGNRIVSFRLAVCMTGEAVAAAVLAFVCLLFWVDLLVFVCVFLLTEWCESIWLACRPPFGV